MLDLNLLNKTYANGVHALDNVSLAIPKGLYGLLGPNGAGKSSLMRTLATLQGVDSGSIHFDGIDVLKEPMEIRHRLGYLPQDFGVYQRISAAQLLEHLAILKGLTNRRKRRAVVTELLQQTNLFAHRKKAVSDFSGGMRQRFGIAQALLGDPDLLIVDEPTAGLDPEERQRFNNLLIALGRDKVIILSTHIVEDIAELCANVAILAAGKILLQGSPSVLVGQLQGRVWSKIVSIEEAADFKYESSVISKRLSGGNMVIHVLSSRPPSGFELVNATLEDVYFAALQQQIITQKPCQQEQPYAG